MVVGIGLRNRKQGAADNKKEQTKQAEEASMLSQKNTYICRARLRRGSNASSILCAFSMASMFELQVAVPTKCPEWIFDIFAVSATLLVMLQVLSLLISNFLLPTIEYRLGYEFEDSTMPMLKQNPLGKITNRCVEVAHTLTTIAGMFLFIIQVALLSWVRFYDASILASIAGSLATVPFLLALLFICFYFHRELLNHSYEIRLKDLKDIEELREEMELVSVKVAT